MRAIATCVYPMRMAMFAMSMSLVCMPVGMSMGVVMNSPLRDLPHRLFGRVRMFVGVCVPMPCGGAVVGTSNSMSCVGFLQFWQVGEVVEICVPQELFREVLLVRLLVLLRHVNCAQVACTSSVSSARSDDSPCQGLSFLLI